ncbi:MAG: Crp/Fnr family transcriptional regulator [Candidatus Roizmanbacteria bacterium]
MKAKLTTLFGRHSAETYKKGTILVAGDTRPHKAYHLETGAVKMITYTPHGAQVIQHILVPGSFFPLLTINPQIRNRFWFEAMTEVSVQEVPYSQFTQYVLADFDLLKDQFDKLTLAVDKFSQRVESLAQSDVRVRILSTLSYLMSHFGTVEKNDTVICTLPITHQELADFIGASRETVSREWEKLKSQGIVDLQGGQIVLKNMQYFKGHED